MAKKKKVSPWRLGGILVPAAVFALWFAGECKENAFIPEYGAVASEDEVGQTYRDDEKNVSLGINQTESIEYRYIKNCPLSKKVQREIFDICAGANVSFELVMALIEKESSFNLDCVSDEGCSVGLMQIQIKWHRGIMDRLGCRDLYDPVQNVRVGVELLKRHLTKYQDAAAALMAYNGGQAYADRNIAEGKISGYAAGILKRAAEYERENGL